MSGYVRAGSEFIVNTSTARRQLQSDLTRLADDRLVAVWSDSVPDTTADRFLRAQLYAADGTPLGTELTLVASSSGLLEPEVAGLAGGGFVLTWTESGQLRAQLYDASATAVAPPFAVRSAITAFATRADVVALADGGFAIAWQDSRSSGGDVSGIGIRVETYDAAGALVTSDVLVNTAVAGHQQDPAITALASGGYVVTWSDHGANSASSSWLIKAQIFDGAGGRVGGEFVVNNVGGSGRILSVESSVTLLANGNFAVAWFEDSGHHVQVFTPAGQRVGAEVGVDAHFYVSPSLGPTVTALDDGGFVLVWQNNGVVYDGSGSGLFLQAYDALGQAVGGVEQVNTQANGDQVDPQVVALDDGGFMVSWTDLNGPGGDDDEVRAQVFVRDPSAPVVAITSSDGADSAAVQVAENEDFVLQLTAASSDPADTITYAITGGADAARFVIDAQTGLLRFVEARDFESRADIGADNVYDVSVAAIGSESVDTQQIAVTVTDVNEGFWHWSLGGYASVVENQTGAGAFTAFDVDGDIVSYAITGGADAALFAIDAATGALTFLVAPDFEHPDDANHDNLYRVDITASDGSIFEEAQFGIEVGNANEGFTGWVGHTRTLSEKYSVVGTYTATDIDGDPLTYTITGGEDSALFAIDSITGQLRFVAQPDYEAPADADGDNVYRVAITASDGQLSDEQLFAVQLVNLDEPVTITSLGGGETGEVGVAENQAAVLTFAAVDPENAAISWSIYGPDASRFAIDAATGALRFVASPNFEAPSDINHDNRYELTVRASDGYFTDYQKISVTVANENDLPVTITSFGGASLVQLSMAENVTAVATLAASDPDGGAIAWSILGGADASRFAIDAVTGALRFLAAPDYEAPADQNLDNRYEVAVGASDGLFQDNQLLLVTITNVAETNVLTGTSASEAFNPAAAPWLHTTEGVDIVSAGGGNDSVSAVGGNDQLDGGAGDDILNGGNGNDILFGGANGDELIGGAGTDIFDYGAVTDSRSADFDLIRDFTRSQGDRIDLSAIDARLNVTGDQAFSFIGTSSFSGAQGQLRYVVQGSDTLIQADINGDRVADLEIRLDTAMSLSGSDFVL